MKRIITLTLSGMMPRSITARTRTRAVAVLTASVLTLGSGVTVASATPSPSADTPTKQQPHAVAAMTDAIPEVAGALDINRDSSALQAVRRIVDSAPNAGQYSKQERDLIAQDLYAFGRELSEYLAAHPDSYASSALRTPAEVTPFFTVGVGRFIYLHHVTPTDQRWMLQAGTGVLAAAICAASAGAACSVAAAIAAAAIPAVSEYFSPSYCLEMQFWYWGALHKAYRTRC